MISLYISAEFMQMERAEFTMEMDFDVNEQAEVSPEKGKEITKTIMNALKKERNIIILLSVLLAVMAVLMCVMSFSIGAASGGEKNVSVNTVVNSGEGMDTVELAEYVQKRTVTVNVDLGEYGSTTGSGFFIDDQGTVVTSYHVVDGAKAITVEVSDGGIYNLDKIVDFDPQYDLAILKIAYEGNPYLEICREEVRTGEYVYAVGSSLGFLNGTFSNGLVSSASRQIGEIDCIQTTAAISSGNSGGPLVNSRGEVVGVNAFTYIGGENLNLAVKVKNLDMLAKDKDWTINRYSEWYSFETDRSYLVKDRHTDEYYLSLINTYQLVTGAECLRSTTIYSAWSGVMGYSEGYPIYVYDYKVSEFDKYIEYLISQGFVFESSEDYKDGTSYYYVEELHSYYADLYVEKDKVYISLKTE